MRLLLAEVLLAHCSGLRFKLNLNSARCNLLLTEVIKFGKMSYAMEIQRMIGEIRREPYELNFFKHKKAKTWHDVCFITSSLLWLTNLMQIETKVIRLVESSL